MMRSLILVLLLLTTNGMMARQVSDTFATYTYSFPGSEIKFTMQAIPGGVLEWGSPGNDKAAEEDERPLRQVKLDPFWMGTHEVTFDEFNLFFNDIELSQNIPTDGLTRP